MNSPDFLVVPKYNFVQDMFIFVKKTSVLYNRSVINGREIGYGK